MTPPPPTNGRLFLENHALSETELAVNGTPLEPGEMVPLITGATLRLGPHTFAGHIE